MLRVILSYSFFRDDVQFLLLKIDYLNNKIWKTAFYIHVFSAVIALFAGFTQFSADFLKYNKKLHRIFGKIYVWNILVINFPTAMILAIYANGGLIGKTAFVILDILWFYFTYVAFICALKKDFINHRYNMIRSYALTFSAITLRLWKIIILAFFAVDPAILYTIQSWLGFLPNLIVAELIIYYYKRNVKRLSVVYSDISTNK